MLLGTPSLCLRTAYRRDLMRTQGRSNVLSLLAAPDGGVGRPR
ncbi:hypothetical protein AB7M74_011633, partial [Bradyrhizobium japonicum]